MEQRDYDEAIPTLEKAGILGEDEALDLLGFAFKAKQDYQPTIKVFQEAIEFNRLISAMLHLGEIYASLGDYDGELQVYECAFRKRFRVWWV
jgi:tetratricopeptide (TPR) repeat protein